MKAYLRLLQFAKPYGWLIPQYFVYTVLFVMFSVVNLIALAPMLNLLFNEESAPIEAPTNALSLSNFYYYLNQFLEMQTKAEAIYVICIVLVVSVIFANLFNYLTLSFRPKPE